MQHDLELVMVNGLMLWGNYQYSLLYIFKGAFELTALKQFDVAVIDNAGLVCNMTNLSQIPFLSNFASMDIAYFD